MAKKNTRSKSSGRWLQEHFDDEYVLRAQREGYRSRAVYKLIEIQEKDRLIKPGMKVIDLGAAPGGWSQYLSQVIGDNGRVVALDLLPMDAFANVDFIQGDFREDDVLEKLLNTLGEGKADLVISDMAPNMSGMDGADMPRVYYLAELALDLCHKALKPGGDFLIKLFHGSGHDEYIRQLRENFDKVTMRKPKASRPRSREVYALAQGFRGGE